VIVRVRAVAQAFPCGMCVGFALAVTVLSYSACVKAQPPTDTGGTVTPTSPSSSPSPPSTPASFSYEQDLKPVFASDCVVCHSGAKPSAGYAMTSYAAVMKDVKAGSAQSKLVTTTQSNGSMYRYFTGNRQAKADMVRHWVVDDKAAQSR
jgi:hypothetical protein